LATRLPRDRTARLLLVDLRSGASRTVLADDGWSYYEPVFAPDGASLLAVREDWGAGRWSIVSLAWPIVNAPTIVLTGPRDVQLSTPIFLADGVRFMFQQERALARATLDGRTVEALAGDLNPIDRAWPPGIIDRRNPARSGWMPRVVTRYFARIEGDERASPADDPVADLVVSDVQTQRTTIPMRGGPILAAVVVE
jgi:hypothetical protein